MQKTTKRLFATASATLVLLCLLQACGTDAKVKDAPGGTDSGPRGQPDGLGFPDSATVDEGPGAPDPGPIADPGPGTSDPGPAGDPGPKSETFCSPGNAFCQADTLFTCKEDGSGYEQTKCKSACIVDHCSDACKPGSTICMSIKAVGVCQEDGTYVSKPCKQLEECVEGKCETKVCEPLSVFCDEKKSQIFKCSADGKVAVPTEDCPYGCDPKKDVCLDPNCTPGFAKCDPDKKYVLTCKPDGSDFEKAPAACKWKCLEGQCIEPVCMPEQTKCGENAILKCSEDQLGWDMWKTCKVGCGMAGNAAKCAECVAGEKKCDLYTVLECTDPLKPPEKVDFCDYPLACAGGKCIDVVEIGKDDGSEAGVYSDLLGAFADCLAAGVVGVCGGLNTESYDFDVSLADLEGWLCPDGDEALVPMFASKSQYVNAKDVLGCGLLDVSDLTIKTTDIHGAQDAVECYAFEKSGSNGKEVVVDECDMF